MRHGQHTTGPRRRPSRRDAPQPGAGPPAPRAHPDHGAAGEGAATFRRANHHDREAQPRQRRGEPRRHCAPARRPRHSGPRRRREAVRYDRAALRGAPGRLHAVASPRIPPGRRCRSGAGGAYRQRVLVRHDFREGRGRGGSVGEEAKGRRRRLRAAAQRLRGKKGESGAKAEGEDAEPKRSKARGSAKGAKKARKTDDE